MSFIIDIFFTNLNKSLQFKLRIFCSMIINTAIQTIYILFLRGVSMEITAKNLVKIYGDRSVVNDVSFHMKKGEVVCLLGPNGAGKTTTFYMIVGLIKPNSGQVFIDDKDITTWPMNQRAKSGIGYLPQENSIFRKLTVEENIKLVLEMNDKLTVTEKKEKLEELLNEFGVEKLRKSPAVALSGGERRRVEIARALAASPDFMLLDEPFAGIDPIAIGDIKENIRKISAEKGLGVLITDHNPKATLSITDRAYVIFDGRIKIEGKSADVANDPIAKEFYLGKDFQL